MFEDMSEAPIPQAVHRAIQAQLDDTVENGRDAKQEEWHGLYKEAKEVAKKKAKAQEEPQSEAEEGDKYDSPPSKKRKAEEDPNLGVARADSWGSAVSTDSGQDGIETSPGELMRRSRILNF